MSAAGTLAGTVGVALTADQTFCLEVSNGTDADGTPVVLAKCTDSAAQQFTLDANTGEIRVFADKCLDAERGRGQNGDKVQIWTCNGYNQQRWAATTDGQIVGIGDKCIDLDYGLHVAGTKVQLWTCYAGSGNQTWTGYAVSSPTPVSGSTTDSAGTAELPRTYLNTAMPAVTGRTISVPAGGDLQGALNAAQPGDQIVLAAGATYTGNFTLPAKAGMTATQWITVRSGGSLPPEGTRVGPADAEQMPKILTPNNYGPAIGTGSGAQGWRITGVEIGSAPGTTWNYSLVNFGSGGSDQTTSAQVPSRIVLDRSYVHGSPTFDLRRCVSLNSASSAVIDSYLAECHSKSNDSQAILGGNGPGPYKIVNNHLEAGHEVIMFGGNDPMLAGVIASDIELRHNYVTRPLSWKGVWQVKNLLEFKAAQRLLIEGNVFENNWADAQNGFAFVWWSVNQDGRCTWCVTQDVTFRYNRVANVAQGFNLTANGGNTSVPARRITIAHNVITGVDASGGRLYQVNGAVSGLTIVNNSGIGGSQDVYFITPSQDLPTFVYKNNVTGGVYPLFGDGGYIGASTLTQMAIPAANVTGNVIYSGSGSRAVPPGNTFAASPAAIGFVNLSGGDLTLSASSPYRTSGTGGTLPGADMRTLSQRTAGVVR